MCHDLNFLFALRVHVKANNDDHKRAIKELDSLLGSTGQ